MIRFYLFFWMLIISAFGQAQKLVGHWTFEPGEELKDRTGYFEDIVMEGTRIEDGMFVSDTVSAASAKGYTGPDIGSHTLVFWIELLDIEAGGGLPFAIWSPDSGFDVLAYDDGGIRDSAWYIGSGDWLRSKPLEPGFVETSVGDLIQMAVSYEYVGTNEVEVTAYRNGLKIGQYRVARQKQYRTGSAVVWFSILWSNHTLRYKLEEARLYDGALTQEQIKKLKIVKVPADASYLWWWTISVAMLLLLAILVFLRRKRITKKS